MVTEQSERVLELVVFRVKNGVTREQLLATASLVHAEAAAKAAESSEQCAPMFALIDMESAQMLHGVPAIPPVVARP